MIFFIALLLFALFVLVDSDTESDDEQEADGSSVFYSIYETRAKQKQQFVPVRVNAQSYLSLNLCIGQGLLNMNPPVRDSAGNVIPGQQGEFLLWIEKVHLFVVSGYCGDDDLGYICVQARDGHLHHCGNEVFFLVVDFVFLFFFCT